MSSFLRQNWLWIVAPIVLLLALLLLLLLLGPGDEGAFVYPIF